MVPPGFELLPRYLSSFDCRVVAGELAKHKRRVTRRRLLARERTSNPRHSTAGIAGNDAISWPSGAAMNMPSIRGCE